MFRSLLGLVCLFAGSARAELLPPGTIADRVRTFGPAAEARLLPHFEKAGVRYPPARVLLLGLKEERTLGLYAASSGTSAWRFIRSYPVLAASGTLGPKLRQGDLQVPEGVYGVEYLNPNSQYHLSLKISYPNAFDRRQARAEGRANLGGDIMIHGKDVSIGCLAMGDPAAEELFVLAAKTGLSNITVLLAPGDFRKRDFSHAKPWVQALYAQLRAKFKELP